MAKKALGKGLSALIGHQARRVEPTDERGAGSRPGGAEGGDSDGVVVGERVRMVSIGAIEASALQPRKVFRESELDELVASLREHGVIQPLIVRAVAGRMELIAGERRWRAAQQVGMEEVPVIVREASDRDVLEMALIENLQRSDLNPVEEAQAYVRLAKEFDLRQEDIAKRVGKNRSTVANVMRLLELEPEVLEHVEQGRLSLGHAKVLLQEPEGERQVVLAAEVVRKGLSVRAAEQLVARAGGGGRKPGQGKGGKRRDPEVDAAVGEVVDRLRERLGTKVLVHHTEKRGRIEIEYYGIDDLDRLLTLMGVAVEWDG